MFRATCRRETDFLGDWMGFLLGDGGSHRRRLRLRRNPWIVLPHCFAINLIFRRAFQAVGIRNLCGARPAAKYNKQPPCRKSASKWMDGSCALRLWGLNEATAASVYRWSPLPHPHPQHVCSPLVSVRVCVGALHRACTKLCIELCTRITLDNSHSFTFPLTRPRATPFSLGGLFAPSARFT